MLQSPTPEASRRNPVRGGRFESRDEEANRGCTGTNACLSFNLVFSSTELLKLLENIKCCFSCLNFLELCEMVDEPTHEKYLNKWSCTGNEPGICDFLSVGCLSGLL